jgi:hypothetical protein
MYPPVDLHASTSEGSPAYTLTVTPRDLGNYIYMDASSINTLLILLLGL